MPILLYIYDPILAYEFIRFQVEPNTAYQYLIIINSSNAVFLVSYKILLKKYSIKYFNNICKNKENYFYFWGNKYIITIKYGKILYLVFLTCFTLYMFLFYIINRNILGYGLNNTSLINSFLILTSTNIILLNIIYLIEKRKKNNTLTYNLILILTLVLMIIFILYSIKSSSRGSLITFSMAIIYLYLEMTNKKIDIKLILKFCGLLIIIIFLSQFMRLNRGGIIKSYSFEINDILSFFNFDILLTQDYSNPGYTLLYAIQYNMINPIRVICSNIGNGIFFLSYPGISNYVSRILFPDGSLNMGGFILFEGYVFAGFLGAVLIPLVLILWYRFYYKILLKQGNHYFKLFIGCLLVNNVMFNVIRGQTFYLFKAIYMYFIPVIILYFLLYGSKERT